MAYCLLTPPKVNSSDKRGGVTPGQNPKSSFCIPNGALKSEQQEKNHER
jgi:hypothetical protein